MGLLTDILIASPSDAPAICADLKHFEHWLCLQFKGLDNMALGDLLAALGHDLDAKALQGEECIVHRHSEEGPWIFHLPDSLPESLASLADEQIGKISERWAAGENLSFDDVDASDLEPVVGQLRVLSQRAVSANKPLLLWMCL